MTSEYPQPQAAAVEATTAKLTEWGDAFTIKNKRQGAVIQLDTRCLTRPDDQEDHARKATITVLPNGLRGYRCLGRSCAGRTWKDVRTLFDSTGESETDSPPSRRRQAIPLTPDLNCFADELVRVLQAASDPPRIFTGPSGGPARIEQRPSGESVIVTLDKYQLQRELGAVAKVTKPRSGKQGGQLEVEAPIPLSVVQNILATPSLPFPPLNRIVPSPIFDSRHTTSLVQAGYAPHSRAFVAPPDGFQLGRAVPPNPTPAEIDEARRLLLEPLEDFPFTSEADRAHAMAFCLLSFVRDLIDGPTPLHLFEKPAAGTGASLLVEVLTTPFAGPGGAPSEPEPGNDEEWRKRITTKVLEGDPFMIIGNVNGTLAAGSLAEALTARSWRDRRLGSNSSITGPVRFLWAATGNNPQLSHEIARRAIRIRLDAKVDQPWLRHGFRHRLPEWAVKHREDLMCAALTLASAWIAAGCPDGESSLGSYDAWAKTMGGLLMVGGIPGFLDNIQAFYATADSEGTAWQALVGAWWETFGSTMVTSAHVLQLARGIDGFRFDSPTDHGMQTEFGQKLRKKVDNKFAIEAGKVTITSCGTTRTGAAQYTLIHEAGVARQAKPPVEPVWRVFEAQGNPFQQTGTE